MTIADHASRALLALDPVCVVERCACGAIHLTIGAVTLRLQPEAFLVIAETMARAARTAVLRSVGDADTHAEACA